MSDKFKIWDNKKADFITFGNEMPLLNRNGTKGSLFLKKEIIMEYYIKPRLYLVDQKYWMFSDEIHQMDISMIQDGIDSCEGVMSGKFQEMSWGLEVSELIINKETSRLEYHGCFVTEIPTIEICSMLKEYLNSLKSFEKK